MKECPTNPSKQIRKSEKILKKCTPSWFRNSVCTNLNFATIRSNSVVDDM